VLVLASAISLIARAVHRPWFTIPIRIVGSWLVAIGVMFAAVLLRPGSKPGVDVLTAVAPIPVHDSNLPHIHGPNGEIIYLSTRGGSEAAIPGNTSPIAKTLGNRVQP